MSEHPTQLAALLKDASKGPWEADSDDYGMKGSERIHWAIMLDAEGKTIFDGSNNQQALIHEEYDDEFHHQWDEVGRANFALIAWLRNNAPALISAQAEEIERLRAVEEEAIFLIERLADFDNDSGNKTEDGERDWHGNVAPSLSRLKKAVQARAALQSAPDGMGAE